jgi:plasmid stabilization system protein ParE
MKPYQIRWSDEALRNLEETLTFIEIDSPSRAASYIEKIFVRVEQLRGFPKQGRIVPELSDEIDPPREIVFERHRILYRISRNWIEIVSVFHARRRFGNKRFGPVIQFPPIEI